MDFFFHQCSGKGYTCVKTNPRYWDTHEDWFLWFLESFVKSEKITLMMSSGLSVETTGGVGFDRCLLVRECLRCS